MQRWLDRQFTRIAVLPTTIVMLPIFGLPLLFSFYLSFQGWCADQSLFAGSFAGIANYEDLLTDPALHRQPAVTFGYTAGTVAAELALRPRDRAAAEHRPAVDRLLPHRAGRADDDHADRRRAVLEAAARSRPWRGQLLDRQPHRLARPAGYRAVLGHGGECLAERALCRGAAAGRAALAAERAGGGGVDRRRQPLQVFWHVTLPLLRPYILVALLLRTIFEFRAFDNIYVMTSGGPANATMMLSMFTYLASFVRFDLSLGAAASWLMLLMSCCCACSSSR